MEKRFKAQEKRAKREERKNAPEPVAETVVVDGDSNHDDPNDDDEVKG